MLSSIHPLGERARGHRWAVTVAVFAASSAAGGAATGALAAAVGATVGAAGRSWALAGAVLAAAVALAVDATGAHRRFARPHRQVDETWSTRYRRWVYAGGWGIQLGAGVLTVVPAATGWLVFVLAALTGSPRAGAVIGFTFGAVRGASLLAPARVLDPGALRRFHARMARRARWAHGAAVAADAAIAVAVAAALVAPGGAL